MMPVTAAQTDQQRAREIELAREAVTLFRDATREARLLDFRTRDPLVMVLHRIIDKYEQAATDTARIAELEQENAALRELVRRTAELSRLMIDADAEWQLITDCRAQIAGASHATSR